MEEQILHLILLFDVMVKGQGGGRFFGGERLLERERLFEEIQYLHIYGIRYGASYLKAPAIFALFFTLHVKP